MAALHTTKSIPRLGSLSLSQKAYGVSFTSASKHSQGRHASEETNNGYDGDEAIRYSGGKKSEDYRSKMEEGKDRMKEGAEEMKDIPMDGMKEANEKMKEKVVEMKDKAKETVAGAWDAAKGTSQKIKEIVVGTSDDDDDDDWGDDRIQKPKVTGENMENLGRKGGNLDHEKKDY